MVTNKEDLMKSERQVAMVFDLNKCIGCQTCSVACKVLWTREEGMDYQWWCTVNTQPGGGPPPGGPNGAEDQGGGESPNAFFFSLPRLCNHCTHPVCVEACPRNAMYKRSEDGVVLRDETRCRGYRFCLEARPYKKIYFNYVKKISQHCIFCFPRIEKEVAPACARQCPRRLGFVGYLDDQEGPLHKLVREWEGALPLHPEYGTGANVFYIPPFGPARLNEDLSIDETTPRIPIEYLEKLFGPRVSKALDTLKGEMAKTRNGDKSALMDMLIVYHWLHALC